MTCELAIDLTVEGDALLLSVTLDGQPVGDVPVPLETIVCSGMSSIKQNSTQNKTRHIVTVDDLGECSKDQYTPIVEVDASSQKWDIQNPNWVDPSTCPEFTELRVRNDPSSFGTGIYRNQDESIGGVLGGLQWHIAR